MHADWIELFALFEKHKVRYLVIGGIAVNFYGHERLTKNLDVWISPDKQNAANTFAAAKEFGVLPSYIAPEDFEGPDNFIVMGAEPFRIDLIMGPPGVDFETAYNERVFDERETVKISYISLVHLIELKKAADRFTDQRDVQMLEIAKEIEDEEEKTGHHYQRFKRSMTTHKFTWDGDRDALEQFSDRLAEEIAPPASAVSIVKDDATLDDDKAAWHLEAYFENPPDMNVLTKLAGDLGDPAVEELPDIDWVAHSLDGLGVVQCGRFVLYGKHDADKISPDGDDIPIRIDANLAFGTGHHPTTAGCLTLLDRFSGWAPKSILDLGCGSAVLAIAAAKLWSRKVLASDIDEDAIEIALENTSLNNVSDKVTAIVADGFDDPAFDDTTFDFVFANILAGPLAELAPQMAERIAKNGRVMLAGLMAEQEDRVVKAYETAGFRQINRLDHETWPVLLLVRQ